MKLKDLIHTTGRFVVKNGPVFAVMGLYAGIVASYFDTI